MNPKLLMFDFDGVIADSLVPFHHALREVCASRMNGRKVDRATFLDLFDENMIAGLRRLGIEADNLPNFLEELGVTLEPEFQSLEFFPGVVQAISKLARKHAVFVVTSNLSEVVKEALTRHNVTGVQRVIGSDIDSSKVRKIEQLRTEHPVLAPFYIGDTVGDMLEGRLGGAKTIGATWGWHGRARLERGSPDLFINHPADLLSLFP